MMIFLDMAQKATEKQEEAEVDKDKTKLKYKSAGRRVKPKDAMFETGSKFLLKGHTNE
tara:strand:+ start:272 stop:445 length:174 start_codon:yes stop_codon:yes gene_type:complete